MAGLDLRSREALLKGGQSGPGIVPGDAAASELLLRMTGKKEPAMPLTGSLTPEEIQSVRNWIDEGAPWEQESAGAAVSAASQGPAAGITESDRQWWAFQRPAGPAVPPVEDARWNRNPIDSFIKRTLDDKKLQPAPPADKRTLIRRAYLDLTGLLPSPEEVDAFAADPAPEAFAKLIDRLLASPHYGERWARHWLDVARYADSMGYEQDFDLPDAWRYRDYVVESFNEDKPYDRFIMEQLAGDELDEPTFETLTATGFHRVGPRVGFREKDNPEYRYTYLDDMIGTTSRAFMGLSVNCARCHDHKFDPIPQVDYYRMMATFFPYVPYDFPLAPPAEVAEYEARKAAVEAQTGPLEERLAEIEKPYREQAFEARLKEFPNDIQVAVHTPPEERTEGQKLLAAQVISIGPGRGYRNLMSQEDRELADKLRAEVQQLEKQLPEPLPVAMGIRDGDYRFTPEGPGDEVLPGKGNRETFDFEGSYVPEQGKPYVPPQAYMLPTGSYEDKGREVEPGFLQVLLDGETPPAALPPDNGTITTGRRRALAEWIASEEHPLTARVMVNRIWQHHFGQGIVSTPSNFGRMGRKPSHPELLDWLATEFVRGGWSMKRMHRLIMNTEAYQMASSHYVKSNSETDPANVYLYRFPQQRLEGEVIRDIILTASGNLDLTIGGKPYFPAVEASVRKAVAKGIWKVNDDGPDVWRRGLYAYYKRGMRYPMFDVFDQPDPNVTCEERSTTTVPTQALTLLNNEFVLTQARLFAKRVWEQAGAEQDAQVRGAYRIALSREPSPREIEMNVRFLNEHYELQRGRQSENAALDALADLCDVILNLNEFVYIN